MAGPTPQPTYARPPPISRWQFIRKHWFAVEATPIYAVVVVACGGASWYLWRLANGHEILWDRHGNPTPWNDVKPGQTTKLLQVNTDFEKYKRSKW